MFLYEWVIIIVAISLIIIALIFGRYIFQTQYGWGTWSNVTTSKCHNETDNCSLPATQIQSQRCEPNFLTRRGCLDNGVQTYATRETVVDCKLQCRKSKWDISVGPCVPPDPCTTTPTGGVVGSQEIVYTCVVNDTSGINACTIGGLKEFNTGQFQEVKVYQPGDTLTFHVGCAGQCPAASKLLENDNFEATSPQPYYDFRSDCLAPYPLYESTDPQPCRWVTGNEIVYMLKTPQGYLTSYCTPNSTNTLMRFRNWNRPKEDKLWDTPLTWIPQRTYRPDCNQDQIDYNSAAFLVFVNKGGGYYNIALLLSGNYWGWLTNVKGYAYWRQSRFRIDGPGILAEEADEFYIPNLGSGKISLPMMLKDAFSDKEIGFSGKLYIVNKSNDMMSRELQNCNIFA